MLIFLSVFDLGQLKRVYALRNNIINLVFRLICSNFVPDLDIST